MRNFSNTRIFSKNNRFTKNTGDVISDRFLIEKPIGQGGLGEVYLVSDQQLNGTQKALKLIVKDHFDNGSTENFSKEFQFLHLLNHVSFVKGFELGRVDPNHIYYTMEHVKWPTLGNIFDNLTIELSLNLLYHLALELSFIHSHQIVHYNLKPNNIFVDINQLLTSGKLELPLIKISDFGLSQKNHSNLEVIDNETYNYSAPEIFKGGRKDSRADIFSFGMIAYTLLTKRTPFADDPNMHQVHQKGTWIPEYKDWEKLEIAPELCALLTRCLNPNPAIRPNSISEVIGELYRETGQTLNGINQLFLSPFVGRTNEIRYLSSAMNDVKNKEQWAFVYSGESEIGKSRLIDEFSHRQQMTGLKVVRLEGKDITPLNNAFNSKKGNEQDQLVFTDLRELWPRISSQFLEEVVDTPVVICWHKFDEVGVDSIRVFKEILLTHQKIPVLWLLEISKKLEELTALSYSNHLNRRHLEALSGKEIEDLIGKVLGEPHGYKKLGRQLYSFVGGKPNWLMHTLRQLAGQNHITFNNGKWFIPDPDFVDNKQDTEQFVSVNLNKLSRSTRLVLEWLAVLNRRCEIQVVRSQLEIEPKVWSQIMQETSDIGIIKIKEGVIEFQLPALRQYVYKSMIPNKRKEMHLWIGRWLEENISSRKALEVRQTIAGHYLIAGEHTLFLGAVEELLDLVHNPARHTIDADILESALEIEDYPLDQPYRYKCLELLGNRYIQTKHYRKGANIFQQLISDSKSRRYLQTGVIHLNLGKCLVMMRDNKQALSHLNKAYNLLEPGDIDLAGQALSQMALVSNRQGKMQKSYGQTLRYRHLIEQMPDTERQSAHWLGCAKLFQFHNKNEEALKCYLNITRKAKSYWDNHIVVRAHLSRIEILIKEGEWKEAIRLINQLSQSRNPIDSFDHDWHLSYWKAMAYFTGGKIDKGMQLFDSINLRMKSHAKPLIQLRILLDLIRVDYNCGFYWRGMKRIREAMGISKRLRLSFFTTVVYVWAIRFRIMMNKDSDKLATHTKRLILKEKHPISTCVAASMLAEYFLEKRSLSEAVKLLELSTANSDQIDYVVPKAFSEIMNTRITHLKTPELRNSIDFASLELSLDKIKQKAEEGIYYQELMQLAIECEKPELAKTYHKNATTIFLRLNSRYLSAKCSMDYANACSKWDLTKEALTVYSEASRTLKALHLPCSPIPEQFEHNTRRGNRTLENEKDHDMREIAEITEMLNSSENSDNLIKRIIQISLNRMNGKKGYVIFKRAKTKGLSRRASIIVGNSGKISFSYDIADHVFKTLEPTFTNIPESTKTSQSIKNSKTLQLYNIACLPIRNKDDITGVLYIDFSNVSRKITNTDKD